MADTTMRSPNTCCTHVADGSMHRNRGTLFAPDAAQRFLFLLFAGAPSPKPGLKDCQVSCGPTKLPSGAMIRILRLPGAITLWTKRCTDVARSSTRTSKDAICSPVKLLQQPTCKATAPVSIESCRTMSGCSDHAGT